MRLRKEALSVTIEGRNIGEFSGLTVEQALFFVDSLSLTQRERVIAARVLKEVKERLSFLLQVGLAYLHCFGLFDSKYRLQGLGIKLANKSQYFLPCGFEV